MDSFSMRMLRNSVLTLVAALVLSACERSQTTAAPQSTNAAARGRPQPKLATIKLWLGPEELVSEIARTTPQLQTGMMFRTNMGENEGMIFVLPVAHRASFYMKNTIVPLTCAYLDRDGKILELHDMTPENETPVEASHDNIQFVLETRQGWFERHNVRTGVVVVTEAGSLHETFFGRP